MKEIRMTLSEAEAEWIQEIRTIQAAHPDQPIQILTEALSDEDAKWLKAYVSQAMRAIQGRGRGEPFFIAMNIAADPQLRRLQYQSVMQNLAVAFGAREGEDKGVYFDLKLIMH